MKLDFMGHKVDVFLVDDGTMDTVINVAGREYRFDGEYAADFRESNGAMAESGLADLAREILHGMDEDEYFDLVKSKEVA